MNRAAPAAAAGDAAALVRALRDALQQRGGAPVALIETHISWVLLAGDDAYKLKKPLRLPFVDYGTRAARARFCHEELRLNRRLAPSLYLGVSRITAPADAPEIDGAGAVLDHAVHMRRFDAGALFVDRLAAGTLHAAHIDRLAALLGAFHEAVPAVQASSRFGHAQARRRDALDAVDALRGVVDEEPRAALREWLDARGAGLAPLWEQRRAAGRVRECHGDLHLRNLLVHGDEVLAFDGIEFNPALRWIDVVDDIAFAVMDLLAHGRRDYAFRLLDGWLGHTADHAALPALRFALAYRALVRAEVAALSPHPAAAAAAAPDYFGLARTIAHGAGPRLLITHGLPGSGKTQLSQRLLEDVGAVRVRSDVERKRLAGLGALDDSRARGIDLYGAAITARTYAELLARARLALAGGFATIIDAAHLRRAEREQAAALARGLGVPFTILDCRAALPVLRERVAARRARRDDASEADLQVLERLAAAREPLEADEAEAAIVAGDGGTDDTGSLTRAWLERR